MDSLEANEVSEKIKPELDLDKKEAFLEWLKENIKRPLGDDLDITVNAFYKATVEVYEKSRKMAIDTLSQELLKRNMTDGVRSFVKEINNPDKKEVREP